MSKIRIPLSKEYFENCNEEQKRTILNLILLNLETKDYHKKGENLANFAGEYRDTILEAINLGLDNLGVIRSQAEFLGLGNYLKPI